MMDNRGKQYDLVFMDLHMPILDGFQTISKLRDLEHNK